MSRFCKGDLLIIREGSIVFTKTPTIGVTQKRQVGICISQDDELVWILVGANKVGAKPADCWFYDKRAFETYKQEEVVA